MRDTLIRDAIISYDYNARGRGDEFPLLEQIEQICIKTDNGETGIQTRPIENYTIAGSQKLSTEIHRQFQKARDRQGGEHMQRRLWAGHILRLVDKSLPTSLGSTFFPPGSLTVTDEDGYDQTYSYGSLYKELLCFQTAIAQHYRDNVEKANKSGLTFAGSSSGSNHKDQRTSNYQKKDNTGSGNGQAKKKQRPSNFDSWKDKDKRKWIQKNEGQQKTQHNPNAASSSTPKTESAEATALHAIQAQFASLAKSLEAFQQASTLAATSTTSAAGGNPAPPQQCHGCGRQYHSREACSFGKSDNGSGRPHPGFVNTGTWDKSQTARNLGQIKGSDGKPYRVLQYGKHAVKQADGTWHFDDCGGPSKPPPKAGGGQKVSTSQSLRRRSVGRDLTIDITSAYSLLHRKGTDEIEGQVRGDRVTVLLDTGATEFNYTSTTFVAQKKLPIYMLPYKLRVRSVHTISYVTKYTITPITMSTQTNIIELVIPCLILR